MYNSRLFILFSVFCISVHFGSVAGFDLDKAKHQVKSTLEFLYTVLGEGVGDTSSIDNADDLSELRTAANQFITQDEVNRLHSIASNNAQTSIAIASAQTMYINAFTKLLNADPATRNESIPLTGDFRNIL